MAQINAAIQPSTVQPNMTFDQKDFAGVSNVTAHGYERGDQIEEGGNKDENRSKTRLPSTPG